MTTQSESLRLAELVALDPFTWPGGYPRYAITSDGAALCPHCCRSERQSIATTTGSDGWRVVASAVNWEDAELTCSHCSAAIPAAYA